MEIETTESKNASVLYMIESRLSLAKITKALLEEGGGIPLIVRVVKDKYGKETNLTIALMDPSIYDKLCAKRPIPLYIHPYKFLKKEYPQEGEARELYVPIPPVLQTIGFDPEIAIRAKFAPLVHLGVIDKSDFEIEVPLKSREHSTIKGYAIVRFRESVPTEAIMTCKIALHQTRWGENKTSPQFKCHWLMLKSGRE